MNCSEMLSNVVLGTKKSAISKMEFFATRIFPILSLSIHKTWDSMGRAAPWVTRLYHFQPLLKPGNLPSNTEAFFIEINLRKKKWLMCCG